MENKNTVVLGASNKPEKYSNKAINFLLEKGYDVIPVHPCIKEIEGIKTVAELSAINDEVDTVTVYVNPKRMEQYTEDVIKLKPRRVIFNPGTESDEIEEKLSENGIETVRACTLVMLRTGQF